MAITIATPGNSFVQLSSPFVIPVAGACDGYIINMDFCLPAYRSSDIDFELLMTGMEDLPGSGEYVLKLVSDCTSADVITIIKNDASTTEIFATIVWEFNEDESVAIGHLTIPVFDFDNFLEDYECFRIALFAVAPDLYQWNGITAPGLCDITLTINGSPQEIGQFSVQAMDDIVAALETLGLDDFSVVDADSISTINASGNTYADLVLNPVAAGATQTITPDVTEDTDDTVVKCSTCFQLIPNTCFTAVIKYRGNEDSFGFLYEQETAFYNKIRLPILLNSPQPIVEETVFRLSDGSLKQLSARFQKEYEGSTDYLSEDWHFKLSIALKHDLVYLDDVQYLQEGKYEIGWLNKPGTNVSGSPAKFKVRQTPYFQLNSNCV